MEVTPESTKPANDSAAGNAAVWKPGKMEKRKKRQNKGGKSTDGVEGVEMITEAAEGSDNDIGGSHDVALSNAEPKDPGSQFKPRPRSVGKSYEVPLISSEDAMKPKRGQAPAPEPRFLPKPWCAIDPNELETVGLGASTHGDMGGPSVTEFGAEASQDEDEKTLLNPHLMSSSKLDVINIGEDEGLAQEDDFMLPIAPSRHHNSDERSPFVQPIGHGFSVMPDTLKSRYELPIYSDGIETPHQTSSSMPFLVKPDGEAKHTRFDGIWRDKYLFHEINGVKLIWSNKSVSVVKAITDDAVSISFGGKVVEGTLDESGNNILWNDGDTWVRLGGAGDDCLDGTWLDKQLHHVIQGNVLQWSNSEITYLERLDSKTVAMSYKGSRVEGKLSEDNDTLQWNDGYSWTRAGLDGVWQEGWSYMRNVLRGSELHPPSGSVKMVQILGKTTMCLEVDGVTHQAHLDPLGTKLTWSDGDVWTRVMG